MPRVGAVSEINFLGLKRVLKKCPLLLEGRGGGFKPLEWIGLFVGLTPHGPFEEQRLFQHRLKFCIFAGHYGTDESVPSPRRSFPAVCEALHFFSEKLGLEGRPLSF